MLQSASGAVTTPLVSFYTFCRITGGNAGAGCPQSERGRDPRSGSLPRRKEKGAEVGMKSVPCPVRDDHLHSRHPAGLRGHPSRTQNDPPRHGAGIYRTLRVDDRKRSISGGEAVYFGGGTDKE